VSYTYDVNPLDPGNYTNSWGRLTGVSFQQQSLNQDQFAYYYSYNQAGRVTTDTFQASNGSSLLANLAATYAWDNQGRMTNMTYPSGPQLAYQYDAMGRLNQITSPNYPSSTQGYGAAVTATYTGTGQLSTLNYGTNYNPYAETRGYNSLLQLTSMVTTGTAGTLMNMQYSYTAGQNNGRVSRNFARQDDAQVTQQDKRKFAFGRFAFAFFRVRRIILAAIWWKERVSRSFPTSLCGIVARA